jgi:hypothetical protein
MTVFMIDGRDNGLFFFEAREELERCPRCSVLLDKWGADLSSVKLPARIRGDLSQTYDGASVASPRFRATYEAAGLDGLEFRPLSNGYFWVIANNSVRVDVPATGTEFSDKCLECGRFESVIGATPTFLCAGESVDAMSIARTDLEFASGNEKTPLFVCGAGVAKVLRESGLRGFVLEPLPAFAADDGAGENGPSSSYEDLAIEWQYAIILLLQKHLRARNVSDKKAKEIVGDFIFDLSMLHDQEGLAVGEDVFIPRVCFVDSAGVLVTSDEESNLHDYAFGSTSEAYGE